MTSLLHDLIKTSRHARPANAALTQGKRHLDYAGLDNAVSGFANGAIGAGLRWQERIAVYLPKTLEAVIALFGAARAGGIFVPVNPLLKPAQVGHILNDCDARVLVTSRARWESLADTTLPAGLQVVLVDAEQAATEHFDAICAAPAVAWHRVIGADVAAILYTSGSTGKPKGVVLSHHNMVAGAHSVAEYLGNHEADRLLAVLPLSFDYGFSQLSTAFHTGASVVLMDYLLPRDVIRKAAAEKVTGLAGVPPLWNQLADLEWPAGMDEHLRYWTNSGGAMPKTTLEKLRKTLPRTDPYLMYGLTEAFRSTFLPPEELDRRPDSMGKAIPDAEILLLDEQGQRCQPGQTGELVHRGALVAQGYWNDPERTAERFKPLAPRLGERVSDELVVFSGDNVRSDEDGFLYFVSRRDEMIKTSGNRVSPTELEEVIADARVVTDAIAFGVAHPMLGQAIVLVAVALENGTQEAATKALIELCRDALPNFMQPQHVAIVEHLPRNPNGKIDRKHIRSEYENLFSTGDTA